jgi:hypothetical protein
MFGLEIGQLVKTINCKGMKEFPITYFQTLENGCTWASLGELSHLEGFGIYGEREWLISTPTDPYCWRKSKWKI